MICPVGWIYVNLPMWSTLLHKNECFWDNNILWNIVFMTFALRQATGIILFYVRMILKSIDGLMYSLCEWTYC